MRIGINHIDKLDFLAAYPQARTEAYKSVTIQNAFAAAGLVPYDPGRVISQLNVRLKTPTPPGSISSAWSPKTPHNPKQLARQASSIKALIERRSQSPQSPIDMALNQLVKGCQLAMHGAAILAKENRDLHAANEKQKQKRQRMKKQLFHTGGISIQEARELINRRNQVDEAPNPARIESEEITSQPAARAPPRCSDCRNIGHRRLQCPNRVNI